ncbi:MAG: hypothetical protein H6R10_1927 [Rhodocyclaceae bacterium]|nr:hypothetical protein [Rhodocyclaceae bacterium]
MKKLFLTIAAMAALGCWGSAASALEAWDRHNGRHVEILALVGGDQLRVGSLLELALSDTQEIITGEVLRITHVGHDVEVEILDRGSNHLFFIEFAEDGISQLSR